MNYWFNIENFMPHGHCFLWNPGLLWSMVLGNGIIALSYFSIPISLLIIMRRQQNARLKWVFLMFSAFIFACGMTHVINIVTIWYPDYYLDAGFKLATAAISALTAIALWPIIHRARAYVTSQAVTTEILMNNNQELKRSIEALKQNHHDLRALNRMSGYLEVCNNMDEAGTTIAETVAQLWPDSSGNIFIASEQGSGFLPLAKWGGAGDADPIPARYCWSCRLSSPFPDSESLPHHRCGAADCGKEMQKLCLPISGGGKTLALLHIEGLELPPDERSDTIMPLLIERAGLAISNIRLRLSLEFNSTRDPLTELFNRRYMDEALEIEVERAKRDGRELSLVIFDLDHFKQLNDEYGHDIGDQSLREFAEVMRAGLRTGDIACRYGGEEFVLILPGADRELAVEVANRIRIDLQQRHDESNGRPATAQLTVSAGVASLEAQCFSAADLVRQADQALYQAKSGGRNQVMAA